MKKIIYKNHLIKKKLGQVFLKDKNIINTIINIINLEKKQRIVEIGAGLGALTKQIIRYIDQLTIIEIDKDLSKNLKKYFSDKKTINIIQKNVMKIDFNTLFKQIGNGEPLRIIGNLPYNISIKIIFHLFKYSNIIHDMHLMLQKEVAQRLIAIPDNKNYGKLSVISQYQCKITNLLEIKANAFVPKPKIDSTVVKFIPYHINNNPYPITDIKILNLITRAAFNQRRKTIKNSLNSLFTPQQLKKHGINLKSRAENLNIEQFCHLANFIKNSKNLL